MTSPSCSPDGEHAGGNMVCRAPAFAAFVDQLLADLPEGEERANTASYRWQLRRDAYAAWGPAEDELKVAEARHTIVALSQRKVGTGYDMEVWDAFRAVCDAEDALCLVPAPTPKELRWKLRLQKRRAPFSDEILAAIAADQRRLDPTMALCRASKGERL